MSEVDQEFDTLMQGVREGSDDAVRQFVHLYGDPILKAVRNLISRKMQSKLDADDVAQSVWATFFRKPLDQYAFDRSEALVNYLVALARNKVRDEYRRRRPGSDRDMQKEACIDDLLNSKNEDLFLRNSTPSQVAIVHEEWARMLESATMGETTDVYSEIVNMHRRGYSQDEICEALGVNKKTVRRAIDRIEGK